MRVISNMLRQWRLHTRRHALRDIIMRAQESRTPEDINYPYVSLRELQSQYRIVDDILRDVEFDYVYTTKRSYTEFMLDAHVRYLQKYLPDVNWMIGGWNNVWVTTRTVTTAKSAKSLDIEHDGYHLEVANRHDAEEVFDLRKPIAAVRIHNVVDSHEMRLVEDNTGDYTVLPDTDVVFRFGISDSLWQGIKSPIVKSTNVTLTVTTRTVYEPEVTFKSKNGTIHQTGQHVFGRAVAVVDVAFTDDTLDRAKARYNVVQELLGKQV